MSSEAMNDNDAPNDNGPIIAETAGVDNNNNTTTRQIGGTTVTGLPLDWTQMGPGGAAGAGDHEAPPIRYPLDVAGTKAPSNNSTEDAKAADDNEELVLDVTDGELVLVGTAGQKITNLGANFGQILLRSLQKYNDGNITFLKKVIVRSHLVSIMEGMEDLPEGLELLEMYDNQLQGLILTPNFSSTLTVLDVSYNAIRDMEPVKHCPHLQELYLANNKLKEIAGLSGLTQLKKLDLGANRIRVMPPEELAGLTQLKELWLGKNKIEVVEGLQCLTELRRLDLQSNRLAELPAEEFRVIAPNLEELYLAHNGFTETPSKGGWLEHDYPELIQLDMSRNQFTSVNDLAISENKFPAMEELWLSGNSISDWDEVKELVKLKSLETIYLEYNPIQTSDPLYRKSLAQLLPHLKQIDATMISTSSAAIGGGHGSGLVVAGSGGAVLSPEERIRQYQEALFQRAKQQQ